MIIGESIENVKKATVIVERILNSDEETRDKIRKEQLSVAAQLQSQKFGSVKKYVNKSLGPTIDDVYKKVGLDEKVDDSMMTPYGPPSASAYIIPVPNDIVGLIIGKGGETIRQLQLESGAKIQVAIKEVEATGMRNVFVEGSDEKYRKAKEMIDDIIRVQKQTSTPQVQVAVGEFNPFVSSFTKGKLYKFEIPDKMVGLVIGKQTETLKQIALKSNTKIFIPQKNNLSEPGSPTSNPNLMRTVEVIGSDLE